MEEIRSKTKRLFVAAIDIGTTYSGYAFSSKDNWQMVQTRQWTSTITSQKQPTALLLDSDKKFIAFGDDALKKYMQLAEEEDHEDYYYFVHFKMILHERSNLNRKTCCGDETGKKMEALQVFMHCIKYLKEDLLEFIQKSVDQITLQDLDFVLTVPAIWSDKAKQFMKEAAIMAGIKEDQLTIALEPEAASIFCQYYRDESRPKSESEYLGVVTPGTKYMVCDLGGGTADITVHEKCEDNTLKEIKPASGGRWGGKSVDDTYLEFLEKVFGEGIIDRLKKESMDDYIYLYTEFELQKRKFNPTRGMQKEGQTEVSLRIPLALCDIVEKDRKCSIENAIKTSRYAGKVSYDKVQNKLKWNATEFELFFQQTLSKLLQHLEGLFRDENARDVNTILMVGGFSECNLVQQSIRQTFKPKRIIVPQECGLTVLKGAVYFGHIDGAISRRSLRYTYGIQSWPEFNPSKDDPQKKVTMGSTDRCKDVFFKYATKGENISVGTIRSRLFEALKPDETYLECAIFISEKTDPKYIDEEGCKKLGVLSVRLPDHLKRSHRVEIKESIIFGETEIKMCAEDVLSGNTQEITFDLLSDFDEI